MGIVSFFLYDTALLSVEQLNRLVSKLGKMCRSRKLRTVWEKSINGKVSLKEINQID